MALKPCLVCGRLTQGSRCQQHTIHRTRGRRLQALRAAHVIGRACAHGGKPATQLDHVHPISRGGDDRATNLQPLCAACNLAKSDR
jgi:5-methylcytosine-specific restriction endonuclease McrA